MLKYIRMYLKVYFLYSYNYLLYNIVLGGVIFMGFPENLKRIRKEKKITQKQLADRLKIKQQAISQYENGQCIPKLDLITKLANILNVSVPYLLGYVSDVNKKDLPDDVIELLNIYESLPNYKKNISIELLKVLNEKKEQDDKNVK